MSDNATKPSSSQPLESARLRQRQGEAIHSASIRVRRMLEQVSLRRIREPRVARVYDGCQDGRPWFDAQHPVIVDPGERERVLSLLRGGGIILHAASQLRDEASHEDNAVPGDLRSDGVWIWSDAAAYYLENHWIAPDPDLVAHLATAKPLALTDDVWRRVYAAIRPDTWEGMIWPLD